MKSEWIKPPLGVAPHWFVYLKRMKELNESIQRYLEYIEKYHCVQKNKYDYKLIANWCEEIKVLANLEADLEG